MHLFNLSGFAARFGIDLGVQDFNDAVVASSLAATRAVASRFRFQDFLPYTARRDVFRIQRMYGAGSGQYVQLRLARGFISTGAGFSAYYSESPLDARNGDLNALTNLQNVSIDGQSDYLFVDADQGLLTVYFIDLTDQWVTVTYDCGLEVASDNEAQDVPGWLQDAAEAQAALFLKQNPIFQTENPDDLKVLRDTMNDLIAAHRRYYPVAALPTMSQPGR